MKRLALTLLMASLLGMAGAANAAPAPGIVGNFEIMTQNQYLGADIAPLITAINDPVAFNTEIGNALMQIAANKTPERIKSLAGQIIGRQPNLVGLQEVWKFSCIPAAQLPCTDPRIAGAFSDHLQLTETALGSNYTKAAVVQNFTVVSFPLPNGAVVPGIPFALDGLPFSGVPTGYLQVMDRDVIFARADVTTTPYAYPCPPDPVTKVSNVSVDGCNYIAALPLGPPLGSVKRGFVAVDATDAGGTQYRFVNTHLEVEAGGPIPPEVQYYQAAQLLETVLQVDPTPDGARLIIVGDMNSSPNDPVVKNVPTPYMLFTASNLYDAWLIRPGNVAGLTCCQLEDLSNRASVLSRRIDLIFSREMPRAVKDARLIGAVASDRLTPPGKGLWPSDHASVAAGLRY
jgi:endonuclease/exonuclease/phosphatase family metal-dependent hydrolase